MDLQRGARWSALIQANVPIYKASQRKEETKWSQGTAVLGTETTRRRNASQDAVVCFMEVKEKGEAVAQRNVLSFSLNE